MTDPCERCGKHPRCTASTVAPMLCFPCFEDRAVRARYALHSQASKKPLTGPLARCEPRGRGWHYRLTPDGVERVLELVSRPLLAGWYYRRMRASGMAHDDIVGVINLATVREVIRWTPQHGDLRAFVRKRVFHACRGALHAHVQISKREGPHPFLEDFAM